MSSFRHNDLMCYIWLSHINQLLSATNVLWKSTFKSVWLMSKLSKHNIYVITIMRAYSCVCNQLETNQAILMVLLLFDKSAGLLPLACCCSATCSSATKTFLPLGSLYRATICWQKVPTIMKWQQAHIILVSNSVETMLITCWWVHFCLPLAKIMIYITRALSLNKKSDVRL